MADLKNIVAALCRVLRQSASGLAEKIAWCGA
jgi:hypothetical protein